MKKAFLQLHLSILLAGWTGIFGKLITMSAGLVVFWRIVIAGALLWAWALWRKKLDPVPMKDKIGIGLVGALLMLQWTLFYASIKASNVSIGVVSFSTVGFFTALLEPMMTKSRIKARELLLSGITIAGIALIFSFDSRYRLGIAFGLASAFGAAALAVFFRMYRAKYSSITVMSHQLSGGFIAAAAALPIYMHLMPPEPLFPSVLNAFYLVIFATACTIGMYLLQIQSLERISAFTVNLSYNLEPVYSIIIAMILFGEAKDLGPSFYAGLACIMLSVGLQTWVVASTEKRRNRVLKPRVDASSVGDEAK